MDTIFLVLFWSTFGSIFSLVGGVILVSSEAVRERVGNLAMPFGAGALLAAAFLDLLPEAVGGHDAGVVLQYALYGFLGFFLLERALSWFHHHHHHEKTDGAKNKVHTSLVIVGDTLHNAIDGIAIGVAFLVNPATGIVTSIAVAAHEIPKEVGNFGILLAKGMRPRRVIAVNLASAAAAVVTALLAYWLGGMMPIPVELILAVTAGFFIYIAASDIIPDIHEKPRRQANIQALLLVVGVIIVGIAIRLAEGAK